MNFFVAGSHNFVFLVLAGIYVTFEMGRELVVVACKCIATVISSLSRSCPGCHGHVWVVTVITALSHTDTTIPLEMVWTISTSI